MAPANAADIVVTLEQELIEIEGVRAATVDVSGGEVTTLHVELSDDADRIRVAAAVDVILRRHGLRSRPLATPEATESDADPEEGLEPEEGPEPDPVPEEQVEVAVESPSPVAVPVGAVEAVRVTHRRGMVEYTVEVADGTEASATSVPREEARHQALAEAVAAALGVSVCPHVVEVRRQPVGGREAITVVLDLGDDLAVGTSFERGSAELALARAVASALAEA